MLHMKQAKEHGINVHIGHEELVSCSSDYSTKLLAMKETFNNHKALIRLAN
jgi:hypothetical protein